MFGKKKIQALDVLFESLEMNSSNNYKDAAKENYQDICRLYDEAKSSGKYIDGEKTRVRMIGVDTPESVHADESRNTRWGKKIGFRKVYKKFCLFDMNDTFRKRCLTFLRTRGSFSSRYSRRNG